MRYATLLTLGVLAASFQTAGAVVPAGQSVTRPVAPVPNKAGESWPFVVLLPDAAVPDTCKVHTFLVGDFGGYGSGRETRVLDPHSLALPTTNSEGRLARSLKAVIWCKDFGVALLDVPSLEQSGYRVTIAPAALKTLPIAGRVLPAESGQILAGLELRVFYEAGWMCDFFGLIDCMVPTFDLGTHRIGADGSFAFMVPDISGDPALVAYKTGLDGFRMDILEVTPPYRRYWIESPGWRLKISASYPTPLLLSPVLSK